MNAHLLIKFKTVSHISAKNVHCDQHLFITTSFPRPIYYDIHRMRTDFLFPGKKPCHMCSQNHRITESQNSRGWKGPLWVI